jgi:GntR family transcriptional regulator of vanillate catabolism
LVGKKTRYAQALSALRALVLGGTFAPGQRLSETALAERLGLSRTPLREAMARLVDEGLLEPHDTGGLRVRALSVDDIRDGIDLRGTLEGLALRRAAERGVDPALLAEGHKLIDRAEAEIARAGAAMPDLDILAAANTAFHQLFGRLSGSAAICRELERVRRLPFAGPSAFFLREIDPVRMRRSVRLAQSQHRAILDAVESREGARAEALAREHALLPRGDLAVLRDRNVVGLDELPGFAIVAAGQGRPPARTHVSNGRTP